MRWTMSRGVKCSPGFSFSASLNFRMSASKMVPIAALSTASGCRSTLGSPKRSTTWNRRPASSSFEMVLCQFIRLRVSGLQ